MTMEIRDFQATNVDIGPEISLPPEISTGPKFLKMKSMVSQLHFAL